MRAPVAGRSYVLVTNQFVNGDPFGYVDNNNFVLIGPSQGNAYLCNDSGQITSASQPISSETEEEIIVQVAAVYPAVTALSYEIATFSVGDNITIGGTV